MTLKQMLRRLELGCWSTEINCRKMWKGGKWAQRSGVLLQDFFVKRREESIIIFSISIVYEFVWWKEWIGSPNIPSVVVLVVISFSFLSILVYVLVRNCSRSLIVLLLNLEKCNGLYKFCITSCYVYVVCLRCFNGPNCLFPCICGSRLLTMEEKREVFKNCFERSLWFGKKCFFPFEYIWDNGLVLCYLRDFELKGFRFACKCLSFSKNS